MAKTIGDIKNIIRKVTGRTDQSVGDQTIYDYIQDFYQLEMGEEVRLFDMKSWYEFTLTASEYQYDADPDTTGYNLLTNPVYVDGYRVNFYVDPILFYAKWPETQTYTEQRSTDVLYYNNELIFMPTPDDAYEVKIAAYSVNTALFSESASGSETIAEDYWWRYIAYGAALDILADGGEFEKYAQLMPIFERYKAMLNGRTYSQVSETKIIRNF